ncbi:class I SAM-dependent methyltransferase [Hyphomonas pacifica]|uniref:Uncharacterized protein n=1 Tax=Hyphomonas pacifica TaxID=1280941 RepID=A0A062TY59_9PROT|nr:class I SAM-dependent methyltransferase [Hyphomonas pacifica]KCZ52996.1 hypothetical protein HY2_00295 [Hyphomonas pacifica]RAN36145.1 hypothetical protein HY3_00775 [Hyphomonas pacifica]RAN37841.1 hypothetical protein HY11_08120 [Hyphomonas pacifica]
MKQITFLAFSATLLAGCAHNAATQDSIAMETVTPAYDYSSVFVKDDRPEGDYEQYEIRKSLEVLEFTGVQPGMTVVDLEAGGGVYTELFSRVVGEEGRVFLQNPPAFDVFLGDSVEKRMDGRLMNVTHIKVPFDDLEPVGDQQADLVTWLLGPHELWYTPEGMQPGDLGDPITAFSEISRVLKPGGHFVVIDHNAPDGAPATTGGETHRLAKEILVQMAEDTGLELVEESDMLANPADDRTLNVFDPAIRRHTDRYVLKFEKP